MLNLKPYEFWFITGSQHLYGPEALKQVDEDSQKIVEGLNNSSIAYKIVYKPVVTTSESIRKVCNEANQDGNCAGIITWMHTFSPAKMWITGLSELRKPLLHLHTQFNQNIPWSTMDMNFMNLNQSAHGDREYGYICTRMNIPRKVIVGYWKDEDLVKKLGSWMGAAAAFVQGPNIKVARFGDNMRNVAVTDGDKIEAQIKLGWSVSYYGIGDLVEVMNKVTEEETDKLMAEYKEEYDVDPKAPVESIREQARIEIALEKFLKANDCTAFTTNFEDLHGMRQLPGLAVQHLMEKGYGFGAEGDWKTAALLRAMKIMAQGKYTALMEDYTYNLDPNNGLILGAHMLEVCPTVAGTKPRIEVHPLDIGGKEDPARLVFDGMEGHAVAASLIDLGNRFRLIVNEVNAVKGEKPLPKLPVARVIWKPEPSLKEAAEAWILAGGAHHTSLSFAITAEQLMDYAEMVGIECVLINKDTNVTNFRNELKWSDIAWKLK
ncbi:MULTISPECIES: L-arabinose isomerase [Clostridium]|uniref:L-arabinose isomerase n=1 Tax=Clostridium TaxID=1485 RepID=UPI00069E26DC|nr:MULTISPECIES: L-arabinose isomerase [Clostridium]KOF56458.1 arabinose isomerase [Clostridium sp. DMHC 10]MCD2347976.1 L-arabinose isomerase [Clostridium guangxiense]